MHSNSFFVHLITSYDAIAYEIFATQALQSEANHANHDLLLSHLKWIAQIFEIQ